LSTSNVSVSCMPEGGPQPPVKITCIVAVCHSLGIVCQYSYTATNTIHDYVWCYYSIYTGADGTIHTSK
jgi:hypothetical protein